MKIFRTAIILLHMALMPVAFADKAAETEAEILLNTLGMEVAMTQSMSQMVDLQLQNNPGMAPYKEIMLTFFDKHMNWESLKPDFKKIYSEEFTAEELRELNAFYATDIGKKSIERMPALMTKGAQIGMSRVQNNIGELQEMMKAETERLKALE